MNHTINDYGQSVIAVGAPGSIARAKIEWPKLIERLNDLYSNSESPGKDFEEAIAMIRDEAVISELEENSILAASHYGVSLETTVKRIEKIFVEIPNSPKGVLCNTPHLQVIDSKTVKVVGRLSMPRDYRHPSETDWSSRSEEYAKIQAFEDAYFQAVDKLEAEAKALGYEVEFYDISGN